MTSMIRTALVSALCLAFAGPAFAGNGRSAEVFGGVRWNYLQLNLRRWEYPDGERLDRKHLASYGGRVGVSGPLGSRGNLTWRVAGALNAASDREDDLGKLDLALVTAGVVTGLSWRPAAVGFGVELSAGGGMANTERKVAELPDDWDLLQRRYTGLLFWEPVLTLDIPVGRNVLLRLLGGYSFVYGQGREVGGPTFGLICDIGGWL